jgi:signal transduction histidine kinase/DNA-binding response OmpR family regulator
MPLPEALLKSVFEQAALPLVLLDGRGLLALWNPAFESLFGEIAGVGPQKLETSFFEFVSLREGTRLDYYAAQILLGGKATAEVEGPIRAADGAQRWLRFAFSRIEGPEPHYGAAPAGAAPVGATGAPFLLCALEDISDRALREKRLQEAKDEAEKATHTKSQFLANMSHEIRTPIQTILGVVELLLETRLDTEQSEYVNQVQFSADVLLGLINDILDFSKIEAGRLELETASFDLRTWVGRSVELLAMEASRKGLEIIVDVDETLPALVRGDPGRIRQIIVNLFKNAVKFTQAGGITLTLRRVVPAGASAAREERTRSRVLFEVADTGSGIPDAVRERLFTPFFQADLAQARKVGGTGLGLAISRHLVELMGGAIGVREGEKVAEPWAGEGPAPGPGSVFWFELPLESPEYSAPPASVTPQAAGGGARLLIVDDYPAARAFASRTAAAAGFRVSEAGSGEEALAALREAAAAGDGFAICLIDQNMPRMDGWRLASEITGDTAINSAQLILMAPLGSISADAKMKLLRWFNGYLSKPIKPNELLDALCRALSSEVDLEGAEAEALPEAKPAERKFTGEVLLAEDHEVNRELFTLLLNKMGCSVVTASDGVEAAELGSSRCFDLVLMDIFMPRMSGYEAAQALRDKGYKGPIVAVTASALKGEREKCIEAGMDDILVKPFKKDDLAALLAEYLPEAGTRGASPAPQTQATAPETRKDDHAASARAKIEEAESSNPRADIAVFDWAGVLDTFLGQKETVASLLSRFIAKVADQLVELGDAVAAKDSTKFREVSHSIKGASWNLSARRLGDAALVGENAGREGDLEAAAAALTAIQAAYADFVIAASPFAKA